MSYAALISDADEREVARAHSILRDSRPIPKCHPDRPIGSKGLCWPCYRAQLPKVVELRDLPEVLEPRPKTRGGNWLSPTEDRIVEGLRRGQSNKEIAWALGVSVQTVKNHMSSIFRKTGATARSEVVVMWYRRQAGIDVPAALAYVGEVRRGIARVQGDVDRLLRTVREAEAQLQSLPEDEE